MQCAGRKATTKSIHSPIYFQKTQGKNALIISIKIMKNLIVVSRTPIYLKLILQGTHSKLHFISLKEQNLITAFKKNQTINHFIFSIKTMLIYTLRYVYARVETMTGAA